MINIKLTPEELDAIKRLKKVYPFRITENVANLINFQNNPGLRKQFIPSLAELQHDFYKEYDDICKENETDTPKGIVHRYPNKVLFMLTYNCFGNCRFCFRKGIGTHKILSNEELRECFMYIEKNQINEVIFSGGDPLTLDDTYLIGIIQKVLQIPSIEIIRFHTRILTYKPKILSNRLLKSLSKTDILVTFVLHVNQAEEISDDFLNSARKINQHGLLMFSQTALLKGVNDSPIKLKNLFTTLVKNKIKPYYLFHPDPILGSKHFCLSIKEGRSLFNKIYNRMSGLAIPIYLLNIPGGKGHIILDLDNIKTLSKNKYLIRSWDGDKVIYEDNI